MSSEWLHLQKAGETAAWECERTCTNLVHQLQDDADDVCMVASAEELVQWLQGSVN